MLVLTRKQSEEIRIGDNITIRVAKLTASKVVLGIDAPEGVKILRRELERKDVQHGAHA